MKKNYQRNQNACVQKRPNTQQKRPVYTAKEACIHSKRGLYQRNENACVLILIILYIITHAGGHI